jgi:thiol:disulfide interchange protein
MTSVRHVSALAVLILVGCSKPAAPAASGDRVKTFTSEFDKAELSEPGKVVILDFYADW